MKDKLTDVWKNGLLQDDVKNTLCEISTEGACLNPLDELVGSRARLDGVVRLPLRVERLQPPLL